MRFFMRIQSLTASARPITEFTGYQLLKLFSHASILTALIYTYIALTSRKSRYKKDMPISSANSIPAIKPVAQPSQKEKEVKRG
jgi:TRAP-type uncharacterized transport system fused permease subunit